MTETVPPYDGRDTRERAATTSVSLYERDLADVERVRAHFKLDGFSQAVRRCIRDTVDAINASETQKEGVAA